MTKRAKSESASEQYQPTESERKSVASHFERLRSEKPAPRLKKDKDDHLEVDHPDPQVGSRLFLEAFGTVDAKFSNGLLNQLINSIAKGQEVDETDVNFMLSIVAGIQPRDQLEAMLAAQMAAVHNATMRFARRLNHVDTLPQQDSAERALNKLARTFTTQMEALKRYRTGGQQKVTVEHVTVNEGGQAIVGNVTHEGGGGAEKTEDQSHGKQITNAPGAAMLCDVEAKREAMPSSSGQRM